MGKFRKDCPDVEVRHLKVLTTHFSIQNTTFFCGHLFLNPSVQRRRHVAKSKNLGDRRRGAPASNMPAINRKVNGLTIPFYKKRSSNFYLGTFGFKKLNTALPSQ